MTRHSVGIVAAAALSIALTALVTWPQARDLSTSLLGHHDVYFSIWRVAWIAHALTTSPLHVFDANIFYPARHTLAYSDATFLEGLIAAPMLWSGLSPVVVYNTLLWIGFAGSGVAMFVLARYLTGQVGPALIAAAAFTVAPYRTEHVMHLELQWAMWAPLALWAAHRTIDSGSKTWGVLTGLFFALQVLSCVYYGVFLAMLMCVVVPLLLITTGTRSIRTLPAFALGAVVALVLVAPYAWPYVQSSRDLGERSMTEIVRYSAKPMNYLASPAINRLWGWTADRWGDNETRLFPGLLVVLLSFVAGINRSRRLVFIYAVAAALMVLLSFGVNNSLYRWMFDHLSLLRGLRASARFAILVSAMLSVLAAFGAQALAERVRSRTMVMAALVLLIALEGSNHAFALSKDPLTEPADVYKVLRSAPPGVVAEFPLPNLSRLPGWDPFYSLWSLQHWRPLLNGYSGYYPMDYLTTMVRMESFPDEASIGRLKGHDVRYIVVHKAFYDPARYASVLFRLASNPEVKPWGTYKDALDDAVLFALEPVTAH